MTVNNECNQLFQDKFDVLCKCELPKGHERKHSGHEVET